MGDEGWIVIDPASPYREEQERLVAYLEALPGSPGAIWLTHHHPDHVGGAAALSAALDLPICAHPATRTRLEGKVPVTHDLFHGDRVDWGEVQLETVHSPGHARGHLAFRIQPGNILIAGDLVAGQGTIVIDPPEGDMVDYLTTLGLLLQQGCGPIVPAHGPAIIDGEAKLVEYISHRQQREEQILSALKQAVDSTAFPLDLVSAIYPEVPPVFHPLAARQVLAHLLKLEAEGRVDRPDGSTGVPGTPVYMSEQVGIGVQVAFRWVQGG